MWGAFVTYHSQLTLVNTKCNTWFVFYNSDEHRLWFRQGHLTIESFDSDLDKVLVTYSQVECNQFEFPHVDSNACGYLSIVLHCNYYLITFLLMKEFTAASHFLHCFILQFLSKIVWSILWVVCWSIDLCAQFNMVSKPQWKRHFSSSDILLDHFFEQLFSFHYCTKSREFTT